MENRFFFFFYTFAELYADINIDVFHIAHLIKLSNVEAIGLESPKRSKLQYLMSEIQSRDRVSEVSPRNTYIIFDQNEI